MNGVLLIRGRGARSALPFVKQQYPVATSEGRAKTSADYVQAVIEGLAWPDSETVLRADPTLARDVIKAVGPGTSLAG